jgi:hypothetical protein
MKIRCKSLKKNLSEIIKNNPNKRILFFDESRFGTKSKLGYGWFKSGVRTAVDIKLGFESFYLYSAVEPATGYDFTLILPYVNTSCMNVFLAELSKSIKEEMIIIMDGAGWHKSKHLAIPNNIQIVLLPPYCPELNPVERLWLYLKNNILKNKVYASANQLQTSLENFIKTISHETIKSICNMVNY